MRKKVIILGGGVSGCSAAYWLTSTPELREKYEVTLYQMGWRLGGKGASGRNVAKGFRSEEHGPHIWYGGYENALRMLRDCYQQYFDKHENHGPYTEMIGKSDRVAFLRSHQAGFIKEEGDHQYVWNWEFPEYKGTDGDGSPPPSTWDKVRRIIDLIRLNAESSQALKAAFGKRWPDWEHLFGLSTNDGFGMLLSELKKGPPEIFFKRGLGHMAEDLREWLAYKLVKSLQAINSSLYEVFKNDRDILKKVELADCFLASAAGLIDDIMIKEVSYESLDKEDFQDYLVRHGAKHGLVTNSAFIRCYYDAAFAYSEGKEASFGAGTALRSFLWIFFGYKGSYMYKMQAGMGEIVFTPIYDAIKEHVDVKFFHRVDNLVLDQDKHRIASIQMTKQAELAEGVKAYDPLIDVPWADGSVMKCWPTEPLYEQLAEGSRPPEGDPGYESPWTAMEGEPLEVTDFDEVVFAMPVSVIKHVAPELLVASQSFSDMAKGLRTVRTIATQLWIEDEPDAPGLWDNLGYEEAVMSGASAGEWDIWMDYSAILKSEQNSPAVRHLLYGCGVMPDDPEGEPEHGTDPSYPQRVREAKRADIEAWLDQKTPEIWSNFRDENGRFDWKRLYAPGVSGLDKSGRLDWQYCRTNIEPTERYTTPAARTVQYRKKASESGFTNLTLAGDWIKNGIDIGCVEAASISGMQAAEWVTGADFKIRLPT